MFDFKEYTLFGYKDEDGTCRFKCLDKKNGDLSFMPFLSKINYVEGESSLYIKKGTLFFQKSASELDTIDLNLTGHISKKNFIKLYYLQSSNNSLKLIFIILGILFLGLGITSMLVMKKINPIKKTERELFLKKVENKFVNYRGMTISKNEIENLFQISNQGYDLRKKNRSLLIQNINERGKVKIERVREKGDRRYINYRIS